MASGNFGGYPAHPKALEITAVMYAKRSFNPQVRHNSIMAGTHLKSGTERVPDSAAAVRSWVG